MARHVRCLAAERAGTNFCRRPRAATRSARRPGKRTPSRVAGPDRRSCLEGRRMTVFAASSTYQASQRPYRSSARSVVGEPESSPSDPSTASAAAVMFKRYEDVVGTTPSGCFTGSSRYERKDVETSLSRYPEAHRLCVSLVRRSDRLQPQGEDDIGGVLTPPTVSLTGPHCSERKIREVGGAEASPMVSLGRNVGPIRLAEEGDVSTSSSVSITEKVGDVETSPMNSRRTEGGAETPPSVSPSKDEVSTSPVEI